MGPLVPWPPLSCPSVTPAPKFYLPRADPQAWPEDAFCIPQPVRPVALGSAILALRWNVLPVATCEGKERGGTCCLVLKDGLCGSGRKRKEKNVKTLTEPADCGNNGKESHSLLGSQFNNCFQSSHCSVLRTRALTWPPPQKKRSSNAGREMLSKKNSGGIYLL